MLDTNSLKREDNLQRVEDIRTLNTDIDFGRQTWNKFYFKENSLVYSSGSALSDHSIQPEQADGTQSRMTTTAYQRPPLKSGESDNAQEEKIREFDRLIQVPQVILNLSISPREELYSHVWHTLKIGPQCVHVWLTKLSCFLVSGVSLGFY